MRVRASSPDFWRGQTFDTWNGRVWTVSDDQPAPHPRRLSRSGSPGCRPTAPSSASLDVDELVQTYYLEQAGPERDLRRQPGRPRCTSRTARIFQNQDGTLRAGVRLDPGAVYTVVSQRRLVTPTALRAPQLDPVPDDIARQYAAPPVTTDRVRALAHRSPPTAPTTYDKVLAIEQWMGQHTQYSLDIPRLPKGADAVDQFLFVDRKGFCEQIGTTLVVMLRELGIPARLAVGYTPGERNPFTGLYEVKASDAHAWAEVYFPGVGWQGFDPTAQVPLAGDSQIDAAGTGALSYLSAAAPHPERAARRRLDRGRADRPRVRAAVAPAPAAAGSRSSRSWASQRLGRLEIARRDAGADRARRARRPRTTCARSARSRPGRTRRSAASARRSTRRCSRPSHRTASELDAVDELLRTIESGWSDATNPGDLVPSH